MAFTDHSDLFAAMHENGINATIGQLMLQRPSMFNYVTILFTQALSSQFAERKIGGMETKTGKRQSAR